MEKLTKRDQRRAKYKQALHDYGFLVLTRLIRHFEKSEDFEECFLIKDVIEEVNKELGMQYPTVHGDEAFNYYEKINIESNGFVPQNYIGVMQQNMNRLLKTL